jgi:hypothetical protein
LAQLPIVVRRTILSAELARISNLAAGAGQKVMFCEDKVLKRAFLAWICCFKRSMIGLDYDASRYLDSENIGGWEMLGYIADYAPHQTAKFWSSFADVQQFNHSSPPLHHYINYLKLPAFSPFNRSTSESRPST